jgi:hypothetical protein
MFLRGQPHLVNHIQRVAVKGTGPRRPGVVDSEPNFYVMPYILDNTMAVPRMPPVERTHEELRLANARTTQNLSDLLSRREDHGNSLTAMQNTQPLRAAASSAHLPMASLPLRDCLIAHASRNHGASNVMDRAVTALHWQHLLEQDRLLAFLILQRGNERLSNGIVHHMRHLGLSDHAHAQPASTPPSNQDLILLTQLLRRGM